jgi:sigma-B regulation protein RsbU (phosphoserine phosphatase)
MPHISHAILSFLRRRTRLETASLFVLLLVLLNQAIFQLFGGTLPFSGLINFLCVLSVIILGAIYLRRLIRRTLWRLRNRLIITYVFIGVVPIVLLLAMLGIALYILMGQVATYLVTSELKQRNELVGDCAYGLAWNVVDHLPNGQIESAANEFLSTLRSRHPHLRAIIRAGDRTFTVPPRTRIKTIPGWSQAGFTGLVSAGPDYALAAHVLRSRSTTSAEVFAFEPADADLLARLLPGLASIQFLEIEKTSSGGNRLSQQRGGSDQRVFLQVGDESYGAPETVSPAALPPAKAWWDILVSWGAPVPVRWEEDGKNLSAVVVVRSRPTLIINQLFSLSEEWASALKLALMVIGVLFLAVEIISLISGVQMTRTITRSVADLYEATLKIKVGDFSRRIPVRTNDQLSELANSFNNMTENIQGLILESKEKERLEADLEIAREVQSQLYPSRVPHLKTLELEGICNPARTVSGDYYDFVSIDPGWIALAIGDIAGKGISAALLMASIQSSLRAQLIHGNGRPALLPGNLPVSTSKLVALLNRQLYENTSAEKFASFCCAVYDDRTGNLVYTNAGHPPPILVRGGKVTRLRISGMVLGVLPDNQYDCDAIRLEPGDLLVAFTDGITEPENEYGEEFGEKRLTDLLIHNARKPLNEVITIITQAVGEWSHSPEPQDDMTLLMARRI